MDVTAAEFKNRLRQYPNAAESKQLLLKNQDDKNNQH